MGFHPFEGVQLELPLPQNRLQCSDRVRVINCHRTKADKYLNKTGRVFHVLNDDCFLVRFRGNRLGNFKRGELELIHRRKRW